MNNLFKFINYGVISGDKLIKIFSFLKKKKIALAAINCIDNNSINSVLEAANKYNTIVIIQFSFSGSSFFIGKNKVDKNVFKSSVLGSILAAKYIHEASLFYKVPVILHTDHCIKNNLQWIDSLLEYNKDFFLSYGKSLFTSHMIDLSNCSLKENIDISCYYLNKMKNFNLGLEIELGCVGGEEDGLDNINIEKSKLYTNPSSILYAYKHLIKISDNFTIAASFGNVHGVYNPGNVILKPNILKQAQLLINNKLNIVNKEINILNFVFHGGSGTEIKIINESINYGVIKINLDTDIQWSSWKGILKYYKKYKYFLYNQIGNPEGINNPNKKFYDPRSWMTYSKKSIIKYLKNIFKIFNCINLLKN